jgi:protein involved in polysaccharide export with SLBB domain
VQYAGPASQLAADVPHELLRRSGGSNHGRFRRVALAEYLNKEYSGLINRFGAARWRFRRAVLFAALLGLSACSEEYPPEFVPPVPNESAAPEFYVPNPDVDYAIGPGDNLLIQSYYHPDVKQTVTVQSDGRVSLLLVGTVTAAGKTPTQLAQELSRGYNKYLTNADVTVTLNESAGLAVYVSGEVAHPSVIPIKGELTLLQGITQAGGFLHTANKEQVLIVRQTDGRHYQTLQANAKLALRNEAPEIYLRRHDIVYVPKTAIANADQFVDQYINQILPRSLNTVFNYSLGGLGTGGGTTVISPTTTAP